MSILLPINHMAYQTTPGQMTAGTLKIVRLAMLAMLLLFVGVTFYVHQQTPPDVQHTGTDLNAIRLAGFGLAAGAMVGIFVIRGIRQRAPVEKRGTFGLIGSALGEGAALLGAVYFFMGGGLEVFAVGIVVFLASWALLPADPEAV